MIIQKVEIQVKNPEDQFFGGGKGILQVNFLSRSI